ncbi:MAG TPA: glycine cleavage T C-terminal barrel domain-containing protein [Candidatus Sulfotelmatobacter sp.]|nr:glycine cleavage T C-terminal barrel domain-containing protein [Candidatus Sulfotelmatobacter sp.]
MGLTALQGQSEAVRATTVGEYRGVTTAARFSDPQAELAALRNGCGVYDLGYRAQISLTGSDRVRWLNGMVTNNVRDLQTGHGVYAFLLNPQGHILGDLYAYNRGESILIDTDRSQMEKILATFDHYIIMDDVEVKSLSDEITSLGIAGPKSRGILAAAGVHIPEAGLLQVFEAKCMCSCDCVSCSGVRADDAVIESYELWLAPNDVKKTWDALVAYGATPVGSEAQELHRIVSGIPRFGVDIRERDLPQETEQERALNFSKGCYIGQEIVERIRSRGAVHRKFSGFLIEGAAAIPAGAKIVAGEKEVGEVTSVASLPGLPTVVLGYIRREVATPGREVTIGTAKAKVVSLPLDVELPPCDENALERHLDG